MATSEVPRLESEDVRAIVGDVYARRGHAYFERGHLFHARLGRGQIRAFCAGGRPEPYRVKVFFEQGRVHDSRCTCPIGRACKHVAALLYAWAQTPEIFRQADGWEERLGGLSKEQLLAVVLSLVEHDPLIEETFSVAVRAFETPAHGHVDSGPFRAQAERILSDAIFGFRPVEEFIDGLTRLTDMAQIQRQMGHVERAAAIYRGLLDALSEHGLAPEGFDGPLAGFEAEVAAELADCFARLPAGESRRLSLHALVDVYVGSVASGRLHLDQLVEESIIAQATDEERSAVAQRLRRSLAAHDDLRANQSLDAGLGTRRGYEAFLSILEAGPLDSDALLDFFRRTDRWAELVGRLLAVGQFDEAVSEVRHAPLWEIPRLANLLVEHGEPQYALMLVRERLGEERAGALLSWLIDFYDARGQFDEAMDWARRRFEHTPNADHYHVVRRFAQKLGVWQAIRPVMLTTLERTSLDEFVRALLVEGQFDRAVALWQEALEHGAGLASSTQLRLAEAAEAVRPALALRIYIAFVEALIERRTRPQYRMAARYLSRIQRLYEEAGQEHSWHALLANLVEEYRRRWALIDELQRANLLED
ncbi:MAG: SWIM zinc finger family protein [Bradymonadaceae bacterium]|nr:SWIM zinc finger family protein [Lujinxingiaceae bacterium]